MKQKPILGQVLFSQNTGNAARHQPVKLTPMRVVSVGHKYFVLQEGESAWTRTKFHIKDWREVTNYSGNHILYESEQSWKDEKEANEISGKIGAMFPYGRNIHNFPLTKLRDMLIISQRTTD